MKTKQHLIMSRTYFQYNAYSINLYQIISRHHVKSSYISSSSCTWRLFIVTSRFPRSFTSVFNFVLPQTKSLIIIVTAYYYDGLFFKVNFFITYHLKIMIHQLLTKVAPIHIGEVTLSFDLRFVIASYFVVKNWEIEYNLV